jgi:hypothetical protein
MGWKLEKVKRLSAFRKKNKSLISLKLLLLIISILAFNSCTERELFEGSVFPSISGLYTEIFGEISGKLTLNKSPYFISRDITVRRTDTLIIEPGVVLFFNEKSKLIVKGFLNATGNRYRRIYFNAYKSEWSGIFFENSMKNSIIKFCVLERMSSVQTVENINASINIINSSATFQNNYFRNSNNSDGDFIFLQNSEITLTNNIFTSNKFGSNLIHSNNSNSKIFNNVFYNNKSLSNEDNIIIRNSVFNNIQNNIFYKNVSSNEITSVDNDTSRFKIAFNFFGGDNNDPMFWNTETFRLYYLSPCKDAGNPSPEFNDVDGSRNDQGAYGGPFGNW